MKSIGTIAAMVFLAAATAFGDGAVLFTQNCAPCHGKDGSGNTSVGRSLKAKDLRSPEVQKLSDAEMTKIITDGKGNMPAFKARFKPEEIVEIVKFLRSIATK